MPKRKRFLAIMSSAVLLVGLILIITIAINPEAAETVITNVANVTYQDSSGNSYSAQSNTVSTTITTSGNHAPNTPQNVSPTNGSTVNPAAAIPLQKSSFSDPDAGQSQSKARFEVRLSTGSYTSPVWSSDVTGTTNSVSIPANTLTKDKTYYWHCKVWDNASPSAESSWSTETSFQTGTTPVGEGDLIKSNTKPDIYRIMDGKKSKFTSWDTFSNGWNFNYSQVKIITDAAVAGYPDGTDLYRLIRSCGACGAPDPNKVYFLARGVRYYITSAPVFDRLGMNWKQVSTIIPTYFNNLQLSNTEIRKFLKASGNEVYLIAENQKLHVIDGATFSNYAGWDEIQKVDDYYLGTIPTGLKLYTTVKTADSSVVYLISGQKRYKFMTSDAFTRRGYNWGKITRLPVGFIEAYPYAGPLY